QALLEFKSRGQLDGFAKQYRLDNRDLCFWRPLQSPFFCPGHSFLTHSQLLAKSNFQHRQAMEKTGAVQVEKGRFLALDAPVLAQVQVQLSTHRRFELIQFEPCQFPVEIVLDRSLADPLGQRSNSGPDFDAKQRFADDGGIALPEQRQRSVLELA